MAITKKQTSGGKVKKTKSPTAVAKKEAWDVFSLYIRTRDCIRFKDSLTDGICVTCKREYAFTKLQAGHFIPGRSNAVLFDDRIVYSQCLGCNGNPPYGKGGNYIEYFVFMEHEWGREKIDEFRALKFKTVIYKLHDYLMIKQKFTEMRVDLIRQFEARQLAN